MKDHRKVGSKNKFNIKAKNELKVFLRKPENNLGRLLKGVPMDEKFQQLKYIAKLLTVGNDETAIELRALLYEQLKDEYKRYSFYFAQLDNNKKASELRQLIKMLPPNKIEVIFPAMGRGKLK
jgi:regulator of sirC expression with transglutaminase-like and TPR domain